VDVNLNVSGKLTALQVMQDAPVIPVIVLSDVKQAVLLARALVAGGIRMLEVTLRTPQALACIEAIARDVPEAVTGAGTVRSAADAQACAMAGARFAVSPGYTHAVGPAMLKAWGGPFGDVRFCPTGGVSTANAAEFLSLPNVVCVGGSWLTPADAVARGDWAQITALAQQACQLAR
jgi:2-dehydro-3-deoxyphosphogluconate aldolase/(4S)-4-hydroxy-2-oxoglutarate aldolase